ncbi:MULTISPECIES: ATP-binding protein [Nocardiopsis]|uniref:ATP-binding protein n=1 Tax=Nocardiopsis lambiniae TaxID=3075539 RepID=A0ABU2MHF2_9ACTN|nr:MULTISPECIES: ATP-binding protein [unclassified Nocardiopsis]MDE3722145.1 ATP-binding protein [Nocardiopsis sp. N85]MDT0331490.1 ATP-binding protein [Nocardiopsis sp. DSM 44743]
MPLPRRLKVTDPDVSALLVPALDADDTEWYDAHVRPWAYRAARSGSTVSRRVARVSVALVRNAHRWTLSGRPGGTAELRVRRTGFQVEVAVTDDGAVPGEDGWYPFPTLGAGTGLRLVDSLSLYWDWEGGAGTPTRVRAILDR